MWAASLLSLASAFFCLLEREDQKEKECQKAILQVTIILIIVSLWEEKVNGNERLLGFAHLKMSYFAMDIPK